MRKGTSVRGDVPASGHRCPCCAPLALDDRCRKSAEEKTEGETDRSWRREQRRAECRRPGEVRSATTSCATKHLIGSDESEEKERSLLVLLFRGALGWAPKATPHGRKRSLVGLLPVISWIGGQRCGSSFSAYQEQLHDLGLQEERLSSAGDHRQLPRFVSLPRYPHWRG